MFEIKPIYKDNNQRINEIHNVLNKSFITVAVEFNLTKDNNPSNGAFVEVKDICTLIEKGLMIYGYYEKENIIGCIGIKQSNIKDEFYIEKLCVLPEKRHNGVGFDLLQFGENKIRNRNGKIISIGIINKNDQLKVWYGKNGYKEFEIRSLKHLPFEVCIMKKEI
jgi:N-acetylglutamate synthase-like GNAT family acetyltransferase